MTPLLEMRGISKNFPGVRALHQVNLAVNKAEVHAVAGENGAGKSTLMKIMTGVYSADPGGEVLLNGEPIQIKDPIHARSLGISIIYQELSMVENLTVAENVFLAREPINSLGFVDYKLMLAKTRDILSQLDIKVPPTALVRDLSVGQKQMIEIAKAISYDSRIIIMDEPTASLSNHETETLLDLIKSLRQSGIAIIYITHRLDEIFEIADCITVLRDGETSATVPVREMTKTELVRRMVDRDLSNFYATHHSYATSDVVLNVRGLTESHPRQAKLRLSDINFTLHKGEILGIFGLVGSGRTEMAEMIFGVRPSTGEIVINGQEKKIQNPADAIRNGIGFVTEDRKAQGLVLGMNVRENFSLTHLEDYCRMDFVNKHTESLRTIDFVKKLGVKTPSIEQKIVNLSGGNQQKVVISKWVARDPQILIVDEPTRGIDVGAKAEVHALLAELARQGVGIVVISSELPEILAISDRILVMKNGHISGELHQSDASQERIMQLATD